MNFKFASLSALFALIWLSTASVDYTVTQTFINFDTIPLGYANGYYYIFPDAAYDPISKKVYTPLMFGTALPTIQLPFSMDPWVVAKLNGAYVVALLTANVSSIISKYPLPTSITTKPVIITSGDYILIVAQGLKTFDVYVFDTVNQEFVCSDYLKGLSGNMLVGWFDGNGLIYGNASNVNSLNYASCTTGSITATNLNGEYTLEAIYGFNSSTVFAAWISIFQEQTLVTFTINSNQEIELGSSYNLDWPYQVNDTSLLGNNQSSTGEYEFLYYVIDTNLELILISEVNTHINTTSPAPSIPIIGTNLVYVDLLNGNYLYDSSTSTIVSAFSPQPPILFSNGSVLNITWAGYTIQSPGEPIYLTPWQNENSFQVPGSPNLWVVFYLTENPVYCRALFIDSDANTITTFYPACPGSQTYGAPTIYDAGYDGDGNMYIAILDQVNNMFVLNEKQYWGPLDAAKNYLYPLISVNITNGTGVVLSQDPIAVSFELETGKVFQTINLQNLGSQKWFGRISGAYFLIAYNNFAPPVQYTTYDAVNNVFSNNFTANYNPYQTPLKPIGVQGSTFTNVVISQIYSVVLIDTLGNSTTIKTSFVEVQPSVFIASSNEFYIWDDLLGLSYGAFVQINPNSDDIEL